MAAKKTPTLIKKMYVHNLICNYFVRTFVTTVQATKLWTESTNDMTIIEKIEEFGFVAEQFGNSIYIYSNDRKALEEFEEQSMVLENYDFVEIERSSSCLADYRAIYRNEDVAVLDHSIPVHKSKNVDEVVEWICEVPAEKFDLVNSPEFWGAYYEDGEIVYE